MVVLVGVLLLRPKILQFIGHLWNHQSVIATVGVTGCLCTVLLWNLFSRRRCWDAWSCYNFPPQLITTYNSKTPCYSKQHLTSLPSAYDTPRFQLCSLYPDAFLTAEVTGCHSLHSGPVQISMQGETHDSDKAGVIAQPANTWRSSRLLLWCVGSNGCCSHASPLLRGLLW